ncbi:formate/nitrite transporter FocA (FNT family) [Rhodoblastus acidophilus]|uniref:formate/nitrite transporter family protein n=1 Tax=Rhodoblastus acidophilus TaxID=1074 RepID=UPI00222431F3|nr:formate/nitrite transporter FocA (FNT family) [Rhodoblastus acidophilus]
MVKLWTRRTARGAGLVGMTDREADLVDAAENGRPPSALTATEDRDVEDRSGPRTPVIYQVVRRLGEEEMARPTFSLWWSGFAAGLSISLSPLAQALLAMSLPETSWGRLVSALGYAVGFEVVILSRQQLFTENTITLVLPLLARFSRENLRQLARVWSVVFIANMAGDFLAALFFSAAPVLSADLHAAMLAQSVEAVGAAWPTTLVKGVAAGYLMAAMVWLLPAAQSTQIHMIAMMTWLIAAGGFAHVVAGGVEAFFVVVNGHSTFLDVAATFILPTLAGNIIGGTALFALLAYAQVAREI